MGADAFRRGGSCLHLWARREANRKSLDALARAVAHGRFAMRFPEGVSHDEPHPMKLRTGVARLYHRGLELTPKGSPPPVIMRAEIVLAHESCMAARASLRRWVREFHSGIVVPSTVPADAN